MKVIIDTNVVVSAAFKNRDPEKLIRLVVGRPNVHWIATQEIVDEYLAVLGRRKFGLPAEVLARWREIFNEAITLVEFSCDIPFPRDPLDAKFLACALAVDADYLITGDRDFSNAVKFGRTTVVTISEFLTLVGNA